MHVTCAHKTTEAIPQDANTCASTFAYMKDAFHEIASNHEIMKNELALVKRQVFAHSVFTVPPPVHGSDPVQVPPTTNIPVSASSTPAPNQPNVENLGEAPPQQGQMVTRSVCNVCQLIMVDERTLGKHMEDQHMTNPAISCHQCRKSFKSVYDKKRHFNLYHSNNQRESNMPPFFCPRCRLEFSNENERRSMISSVVLS